jgi:hypothetical protein
VVPIGSIEQAYETGLLADRILSHTINSIIINTSIIMNVGPGRVYRRGRNAAASAAASETD